MYHRDWDAIVKCFQRKYYGVHNNTCVNTPHHGELETKEQLLIILIVKAPVGIGFSWSSMMAHTKTSIIHDQNLITQISNHQIVAPDIFLNASSS